MNQKAMIIVLVSLGLTPCSSLGQVDGETLAIRADKIWTITEDAINDGAVILKDGKIDAVGQDLTIPDGAQVLEIPEGHVTPGLIDAHCHLGLSLNALGEIDETVSPVTADMRILDAFDPSSAVLQKALSAGVTTVLLAPGGKNPIGGQAALVKLCRGKQDSWLLKRNAGVKLSFGNEALFSDRRPTSRPGLMTLVKEQLDKAKDYAPDRTDPCSEVLKRVTERDLAVHIWAHTVDEITASLEIVDQYDLSAVLVGAEQADEIAEMLAEREIPVVYAPLLLFSKDKDLKRPGKLADAGVKLAFSSLAPRTSACDLRTSAIIATRYGLKRGLALKSLTIHAAEILGISERLGSIEKGKDADVVIFSGDPLELSSRVEVVIVGGQILYQREKQ
ncbi:MAG: amidohydrolase family protein [Phycisphaerales bacterium]|nr:MAG: amidohydrolase family protein [Phycisphaerales bacterium]